MTEKLQSSTLPEFNPSGDVIVAEIKRRTEDLMIFLTRSVPDGRRRSIALTQFEQAAMRAVKAATNPE